MYQNLPFHTCIYCFAVVCTNMCTISYLYVAVHTGSIVVCTSTYWYVLSHTYFIRVQKRCKPGSNRNLLHTYRMPDHCTVEVQQPYSGYETSKKLCICTLCERSSQFTWLLMTDHLRWSRCAPASCHDVGPDLDGPRHLTVTHPPASPHIATGLGV